METGQTEITGNARVRSKSADIGTGRQFHAAAIVRKGSDPSRSDPRGGGWGEKGKCGDVIGSSFPDSRSHSRALADPRRLILVRIGQGIEGGDAHPSFFSMVAIFPETGPGDRQGRPITKRQLSKFGKTVF